jgi:hypothetical protein
MILMRPLTMVAALYAACVLNAQVDCSCEPGRAETLEARQCSLCREAEKQPPSPDIFFLRDANPRKPNRWLALPRRHAVANHPLEEMTPAERTALWTAAIGKAQELFPDAWGVAYNGPKVRTQCHTHIHIGRLIKAQIETAQVKTVSTPAQIPSPDGAGLWIHPVGKKLHVHWGEQICETVLVR